MNDSLDIDAVQVASKLHMLLGVITTLDASAFQRRRALRASISGALGYVSFDIRFVIGQLETLGEPDSPLMTGELYQLAVRIRAQVSLAFISVAKSSSLMLLCQAEVATHRDILVIRGIDTYLALPHKVAAMMKYAFSSLKGK